MQNKVRESLKKTQSPVNRPIYMVYNTANRKINLKEEAFTSMLNDEMYKFIKIWNRYFYMVLLKIISIILN